jgi:short-subunit dehydrogenase
MELRALVTGASSGIGAAFARGLRARGAKLILVARRAERLAALAQELGGADVVTTFPLDLSQPGAPAQLEDQLARRGLVVDMLVNNAGVGHTGRFLEEPPERILGMIDLNDRAAVELARRFVPGMVERGRGVLINVVSTAAFQPVPYLSVYAATKAFLLSFTEGLANELEGSGVQVQALCPGLTATEFQQRAGTDKVAFNKTGAATPDEVVAASLHGLDRGRLRVVVGFQNRLTIAAQRFLPQALVRTIGAKLFAPPD